MQDILHTAFDLEPVTSAPIFGVAAWLILKHVVQALPVLLHALSEMAAVRLALKATKKADRDYAFRLLELLLSEQPLGRTCQSPILPRIRARGAPGGKRKRG